jgi:hypothetical protein
MESKLPCQRCQKPILTATAVRTGGLCLSCVGRPHLPASCSGYPKGLGYWHSDEAVAFPGPEIFVRPNWLPAESRSRLLAYLRSAPIFTGSWGHSFCRFDCGASDLVMGSREYWDGAWVWPEGLAHYVESHSVCLPDEFLQRALAPWMPDFSGIPAFPDVEVTWNYWLDWTEQFRSNDR